MWAAKFVARLFFGVFEIALSSINLKEKKKQNTISSSKLSRATSSYMNLIYLHFLESV